MNPNDEIATKEKAALVYRLINLQAQIDALTAAAEIVFLNHGSTREKFRAGMKAITDASVQKHLERLEGQSPAEATLIDLRKEVPDIDQSLLDGLKFRDEK